jgi:hypothetical protein
MNWNAIGDAAYEAFQRVSRSEAASLPVPAWEDLPPKIQDAWIVSAKCACRWFVSAMMP